VSGPGAEMHGLMTRLFPICRSITGSGVRDTLRILGEGVPLEVHEVPSGTSVFDWTVPPEWNIRGAFIQDPRGRRVLDFSESNLHVVSYSIPVRKKVEAGELARHLHTLPDHPDWIPYRTSYYSPDWGFCLRHGALASLGEGPFDVEIDATLQPGSLTYGECVLKGRSEEEVLISTHVCHPSMANDNLSGIAMAAQLARHLAAGTHRYTYRLLFTPGTIGAITWLALNRDVVPRIRHGLVLTGLGDPGELTYKKSRRGDTEIDAAARHVLKGRGGASEVREFTPYGYDERQYCSPGFDLPVGRLTRTPFGEYPQYHTSADDLAFVREEMLDDSFSALSEIIWTLEHNRRYVNLSPFGEPQLGRRGIYPQAERDRDALLWVLNMSDGEHSLLDIAETARTDFASVEKAASALRQARLIE
jgi:aminopeptidase-like protein